MNWFHFLSFSEFYWVVFMFLKKQAKNAQLRLSHKKMSAPKNHKKKKQNCKTFGSKLYYSAHKRSFGLVFSSLFCVPFFVCFSIALLVELNLKPSDKIWSNESLDRIFSSKYYRISIRICFPIDFEIIWTFCFWKMFIYLVLASRRRNQPKHVVFRHCLFALEQLKLSIERICAVNNSRFRSRRHWNTFPLKERSSEHVIALSNQRDI